MIRWLRSMISPATPGALVLMYHRIEEQQQDPWDLCVSPRNFEGHLEVLRQRYTVVSMTELTERLKQNRSLKNLVCLTFDDGYLDNYINAWPVLRSFNMPASFFLTNKMSSGDAFWWDILEDAVLNTTLLPIEVSVTVGEKHQRFSLSRATTLSNEMKLEHVRWRYGMPLSTQRLAMFVKLWELLKGVSVPQRQKSLESILAALEVRTVKTPPLMSAQQVIEIAGDNRIEIGGHTVNHPALGTLNNDEQRIEILQNKTELEALIGKSLRGFAFPYGHYNPATPGLVEDLGFNYAVTTGGFKTELRHTPFSIPRIQVKDVSKDQFKEHMKLWNQ
jgi:peptidoglycan/xylan/chitin deacetylase (PgdA/CDA1 family)